MSGVVGRGLAAVAWAAPASGAPGVPNPAPQAPPGLDATADLLLGWLKWGGIAAGVAGLIVCGIMMMLGRRHHHALAVDGAAGIPWVLGGLSLVVLSAGVVGEIFA